MSSRAIRKTRAQQEQQPKHDAESRASTDDEGVDDAAPAAEKNPFALLEASQGDDDDDDDGDDDGADEGKHARYDPTSSPVGATEAMASKRNRKGKIKAQSKRNVDPGESKPEEGPIRDPTPAGGHGRDDIIQRQMGSLAVSTNDAGSSSADAEETAEAQEMAQLCILMAIDPRRLIAANEMRQLFGRAVFDTDAQDESGHQTGRRHGRAQRRPGPAGATAGHHDTGGRGLTRSRLRRNIFVHGREAWLRAAGIDLRMEMVRQDIQHQITEYRFIHGRSYQDAQRQFERCVNSMEPDRMVQHLRFNRQYRPSFTVDVTKAMLMIYPT